jgi:hypothetical protein
VEGAEKMQLAAEISQSCLLKRFQGRFNYKKPQNYNRYIRRKELNEIYFVDPQPLRSICNLRRK